MSRRLWALVLFAGAAIAACGGGFSPPGTAGGALAPGGRGYSGTTPIQHVIVVIQENRSFDNFFATFPGANGTATGQAAPMPSPIASSCAHRHQPVITEPTTVPLTKVSLVGAGFKDNFGEDNDLDHSYDPGYVQELDNGKMDGFDLVKFGATGRGPQAECTYAYQYVDPQDIKPYWDIAKQYVLADAMFDTQGSESFTGHQDLIAGGTVVNYEPSQYGDNSIIDNPFIQPLWGCDAPPGSATSLISTNGKFYPAAGPTPCFTYGTVRDQLDAKKISWKYYTVYSKRAAGIWSAFDAIKAVREGSEWSTNVTKNPAAIFKDIKNGKLPAVSWVTPNAPDSDHPDELMGKNHVPVDNGPSWVASVVNAIGKSQYWDSSAIIILWDDPGGFYDHVKPAFQDNQGGLGFRLPMLIVSPYVQPHVEHTQYESASVLKFIQENWGLGTLPPSPDVRAASIGNAFNFTQSPRPFHRIGSKLDESFFLKQPPSQLPVDTE